MPLLLLLLLILLYYVFIYKSRTENNNKVEQSNVEWCLAQFFKERKWEKSSIGVKLFVCRDFVSSLFSLFSLPAAFVAPQSNCFSILFLRFKHDISMSFT